MYGVNACHDWAVEKNRANKDGGVDEARTGVAAGSGAGAGTGRDARARPEAEVVLWLRVKPGAGVWASFWARAASGAAASSRQTLLKLDVLRCSAEELNHSFMKEARKPNGEEYAPDSIYYLCLGLLFYTVPSAN